MSKTKSNNDEPYELKKDEFAILYGGSDLKVNAEKSYLKFTKLEKTFKMELTLEFQEDNEKIVLNNPLTAMEYAVFKEDINNFTKGKFADFVVRFNQEIVLMISSVGDIDMETKGKKEHGSAYF